MHDPSYKVLTTSHFDRLMKKLAPKHSDLVERFEEAIAVLSADPYNKSRRHAIKKLVGVAAGEGQYRLRSGRFRFRYDVEGQEVVLLYCGCGARTRISPWLRVVRGARHLASPSARHSESKQSSASSSKKSGFRYFRKP